MPHALGMFRRCLWCSADGRPSTLPWRCQLPRNINVGWALVEKISRKVTVMTRVLIYDGLGNVMATSVDRSMRCPDETWIFMKDRWKDRNWITIELYRPKRWVPLPVLPNSSINFDVFFFAPPLLFFFLMRRINDKPEKRTISVYSRLKWFLKFFNQCAQISTLYLSVWLFVLKKQYVATICGYIN